MIRGGFGERCRLHDLRRNDSPPLRGAPATGSDGLQPRVVADATPQPDFRENPVPEGTDP